MAFAGLPDLLVDLPGVVHGGLDRVVARQFLDIAQVGALVQQMHRGGMSERMQFR